ncbi:MAG: hypothetical protein A2882_02395 [Phenylobacterium sp. RIFCSPHIGHO2_01_FULL_70_10]|nr:MAG: hypothetical protein A2882_02395 [Phenylobacterium sp. RIFCSPHIGHO2_01_FULL_70_10]
MKIFTLIPAAVAALTIAGVATATHAAPAATDSDYVTRAVRSPNSKDVFVRLVKVPKAQAVAETRDCPMMKDRAAMKDMCERMMGDRQRAAEPAPKG